MTIVLPSSSNTGNETGSGNFRILYDNLFDKATSVIASSENSEFPIENVYDWLPQDFFAPSASGSYTITCTFSNVQTANCMALYNQNLSSNSGTIQLQYYDGSTWQNATDNISPSDNKPRIVYFDTQASTQWRFVVSSAPASYIGCLFFGEYMGLELGIRNGFVPPRFSHDNNMITNVAQNGNFIGRSIVSQTGNVNIPVEYMTDQWARDNWEAFIAHAELKPFFFTWDAVNYPNEHAFAWTTDKSFSTSNQTFNRMTSTIKARVIA